MSPVFHQGANWHRLPPPAASIMPPLLRQGGANWRQSALILALCLGNVPAFSLLGGRHFPTLHASTGSRRAVSSGSFVSHVGILKRRPDRYSSAAATTLSMVIDRLSFECIEAVKESHEMGHQVGLETLPKEMLFAGIVAKPERAQQTLQFYQITANEVKQAAIKVLQFKPGVEMTGRPDVNKNRDEPLPFAEDSKIILSQAATIADRMESDVVRSEHVLLALMGYNNGRDVEIVPVVEVLREMTSIRKAGRGFTVTKFCNDLVQALPMIPMSRENVVVQDTTVVIGGGGRAARSSSSSSNTNTLAEVGVDLTQLALEGKLDMVFGRDQEIKSALRTLGRRRKNNPCLIGDPGVGKTAIAEGIAQVLANGLLEIQDAVEKTKPQNVIRKSIDSFMNRKNDKNNKTKKQQQEEEEQEEQGEIYKLPPCPRSLLGARLVSLELASLVAGTSTRGDFERKVKNVIREASENNIILFIDEIHNLIGTGGGGDGAMNAANLLKPALARGELRVLGATTTPEYRRYIEKDAALERRFQPLQVKEPTVFETLDILAAVVSKYEEFHGVEYTYNALVAAAKLSNRYITDRFLPDKAIDLIDEAGSMVKMAEDNGLVSVDDDDMLVVNEDSIATVISEISGIPLGKLDTGEKSRLRNLEREIGKRIKGQDAAVRAVAKSIRRSRSGMRDGKRPVASLLFCGQTGVGKTELCKALAETYYGQEKDMIRIDMSEYMDRFSTSRLIGAPPGYVGYEEGGQLTEAVRRAPHSVILFDELEKAHEDVLNLLLQIMDEGTLTDGKGRRINFKNNIFVMTSNIGSKEIMEATKGADVNVDAAQLTADVIKDALEEAMRPELLNRIDEIVVFAPLSYENLKDIASNLIAQTVKRAKDDQNIRIKVSDNIAEMVTREGLAVSTLYGARPIRRSVQRYLEDTVAEAIMSEFIDEGDEITVNLKDPNGDKNVVEIKRLLDGKSLLIDIDADISEEGLKYQAAYGELPKLGGPPKKEPGAFQ